MKIGSNNLYWRIKGNGVGHLQTVAGGRRLESDGGGRRRAVATNGGGGRWPAAGVRRWWPAAGVRRWWPAARYDWLDMDMWHSMLALEGVALCVILICFNDIFVKLGTTIWSFALC
ncbi:hypothetical protein PRUPE_1G026300 [Prunus persica]|uniref:Uncharacterized protein n=1 Tax=Prunus persica TaxID=3760 RepID=A0A251QRM6_PRUPE|nr:hypothetical protein PRUPE_1G026300 [Prunus persica]